MARPLSTMATTVLVAATARRSAGTAVGSGAAVLAGFGWALYGTSVFFDGLLLGAGLATFLAAALGSILVRDRPGSIGRGAAAGAVLGLLALERPNALAVLPVALWAVGARGKRFRPALFLALALATTLAPAAVHNLRGGDLVLVSANGGVNLWLGNHPGAEGVYSGAPDLPDDPRAQLAASTAVAEHALGRTLKPSEVSAWWTRRSLRELTANPRRAARLWTQKLLLLANTEEAQLNFRYDFFRALSRSRVLSLPLLAWGLVLPLAGAGVALGWRRREVRVVVLLAGLYLGSLLPFFVAARFRMPATPWMVALAAAGLSELTRSSRRQALAALGVAALLAAFAHLPGLHQDDAAMWNLRGTVHEEEGDLARADDAYTRAVAIRPVWPPAAINLGRRLLARGEPAAAARVFESVVRDAEASYWLGSTRLQMGEVEEATVALERSLAARPESAAAWNLLGVCRATRGDRAQAEAAFERALALDPGLAAARNNLTRLRAMGTTP